MKRDLFNKVLLVVVSVLLLLNLMVSFLRTPSTAYAAKTVQYKVEPNGWQDFKKSGELEAMLNKYGKEGWELVDSNSVYGFIFKK
jgi:hypothetical protein